MGGWRHLANPLRGNFVQRWHTQVGRVVLLGLLFLMNSIAIFIRNRFQNRF